MSHPYLEDFDSKVPAIQVLCALSPEWKYLSREEGLAMRGGRRDKVVLTGILKLWLATHNRIEAKGDAYEFTETNIQEAVRRLTDEPYDGLVRTNEKIYHLLTLGTSLDQEIEGDRKGRSLHYIDWKHPEKNVYHVTDEFEVERTKSHQVKVPDLVLFVNGIPFVVIECKRRDKDKEKKQVEAAIEQLIKCQNQDNIPHLFTFAQLLIGTSVNDIRYGTTGADKDFWSVWSEEESDEQAIKNAANTPLPEAVIESVFKPRKPNEVDYCKQAKKHFEELWAAGDRLPTAQDKMLWAMLRPERLLDFVYGYVVFDAGKRKVARYQQYYAVKRTVRRVAVLQKGKRQGGVIWHTTGSGKSLTMVMLAKALALHPGIINPRVVIVTDRIDLDDQIYRTFEACGKSAKKAATGEELVRLITEGKASVITTVINKFQTVKGKYRIKDENPNVFVLVDESHRSNYGTIATHMRRVFPNACYIAFTGTPLLKTEKDTARKFGGFIHSYTMRQAVEDEAVIRLLYEGRMALLSQDEKAMSNWFDRLTADLSDKQKADLKRKMATKEVVQQSEQRIKMIAFDLSMHYKENFQGKGFKAQLAADSRTSAILYRRFLKEFGMVEAEVIMSQPDTRAGQESLEGEDIPLVTQFWNEMMERFGTEEKYVKAILASFGRADGVEVLTVIDKLLTGFDEPRNTVLYIDKPLKEHNILQAIARVNRIFADKPFGYIVDYRGILGELDEAMQTYDALGGFDKEDVDLTGALIDTHEEVRKLPQKHSDLWDAFKEVKNKNDNEAMEQHLWPEDKRQSFYEALNEYKKTFAVALATEHFYEETPEKLIKTYKDDLKRFESLRQSVKQRYSEAVDYSKYEKQIRKAMDSNIQSPEVQSITGLVDIFDTKAFDAEVEKRDGTVSKATTIATRTLKTIHEKMDEDPVFYSKFGELVQKAINDYREGRITDAEYLRRVKEYMDTVRRGHDTDIPREVTECRETSAYYNVLGKVLEGYEPTQDNKKQLAASIALGIQEVIDRFKVRDWVARDDVIKDIENHLDDYLFDLKEAHGLKLDHDDMDTIIEQAITIAKKQTGY